ncbi:hypothetical protein [Paenibacillus montanisoli]|nr:hypothetical protein [Paenibacillus montanisoli]
MMETKGVLLLSPDDIRRIAFASVTLGEYIQAGGKANLKEELPLHLPLEPFQQLRLLERLIRMHPEIANP